ncbi:MAG: cation:proton antiporter [Planctomycetota bacterium]|nr:cation:proton antiporter [Planctomycetota bacterium]
MPQLLTGLLVAAGAPEGEIDVVADLVIVLGASAFAVLILARIGISAIPAMILTGALIGPGALGLVPAPDALGIISHLAIVFLLFGVGLELHLDALRPGALRLLAAGTGAVVLTLLAGWPLGTWITGSAPAGLAIAMAFSLSSTAVVLKYFAGRRELAQPSGRLGLAILVVQDLAVIAMLAMVPLLAGWAGTTSAAQQESGAFSSLPDALWRIAAVGALIIVSRRVLPWVLRESFRGGGAEALLLIGGAFALGSALFCEGLGFSLELGAFLAGFVLADTPFQEELSGQISPVRDLFMAVFFTTLGMNVDPAAALDSWAWVLGGLAVLVLGKLLLIAFSCWAAGAHASTSFVVGACLAHGGEFSLVLLDEVDRYGLIDGPLHSTLIVLVVVGLIVMPLVGAAARRLALGLVSFPLAPKAGRTRLTTPYNAPPDEGEGPPPVIVAGHGPVGQQVVDALREAGLTPSIIDLNPSTVGALQADGRRAVLGDVRSETVLRSAGLARARALVLTVPSAEMTSRAIVVARRIRPDIWIAARSPLAHLRQSIRDAGADEVLSDECAAAEQLTDAVLGRLSDQETDEASRSREDD